MADETELTLGMLVEHPKWGLGKIVHLTAPHLYVVFRGLSDRKAKRFTRGNNPLVPRPGLRDPILDNLPPLVFEGIDLVLPAERLPVSQAIEAFRDRFPLGFQDPAYLGDRTTGERNYKVAAHEAGRAARRREAPRAARRRRNRGGPRACQAGARHDQPALPVRAHGALGRLG